MSEFALPTTLNTNNNTLFQRLPCIAVSLLLMLASIAQLWSAITCNFVFVTSTQTGKGLQILLNSTDESFLVVDAPTSSTFIGLFCPNEYYDPDIKWRTSRIFIILSCVFGCLSMLYSLSFSIFSPPSQFTWQVLSIGVAITAVLIVPSFLIFDSTPCQIMNQVCTVNLGSFLLVVSCSLYISVVVITQCVDAPMWMFDEQQKQRDKKKKKKNQKEGGNDDGIMEAYYTDNSIDDPSGTLSCIITPDRDMMASTIDEESAAQQSSNCYNHHTSQQQKKIQKKASSSKDSSNNNKKSSILSTASWDSFLEMFPGSNHNNNNKKNTKLADMHDESYASGDISDTMDESIFSHLGGVGTTSVGGAAPNKKNMTTGLLAQPSMASSSVGGEWKELWKSSGACSYVSVDNEGGVTASGSSNNNRKVETVQEESLTDQQPQLEESKRSSSPQPSHASPPVKEISVVTSSNKPTTIRQQNDDSNATATKEDNVQQYPIHISFTKNDIVTTGYTMSPTLQRRLARHQGVKYDDNNISSSQQPSGDTITLNTSPALASPFDEKTQLTVGVAPMAPMDEEKSYQSSQSIEKQHVVPTTPITICKTTSQRSARYSMGSTGSYSLPESTNDSLINLRNKTSMIVSSSEDDNSPDENESVSYKQKIRKHGDVGDDGYIPTTSTTNKNKNRSSIKRSVSNQGGLSNDDGSSSVKAACSSTVGRNASVASKDSENNSNDSSASNAEWTERFAVPTASAARDLRYKKYTSLRENRTSLSPILQHTSKDETESDTDIHTSSNKSAMLDLRLQHQMLQQQFQKDQDQQSSSQGVSDDEQSFFRELEGGVQKPSTSSTDQAKNAKRSPRNSPPAAAFLRSSPTNDYVWTKHVCGQQELISSTSDSSSGQETVTTNNTSSANSNSNTIPSTPKSYTTTLSADAFSPQGYVAMIESSSDEEQGDTGEEVQLEETFASESATSSDSDVTTCASNVSNSAVSPQRRQFHQSTDYTMLPNTLADDAPPRQQQQQQLPPKPKQQPRYHQPKIIQPLPPIIQASRSTDSRSTHHSSSTNSITIKNNRRPPPSSRPSKQYMPHAHNKAFEMLGRNNIRFESTQNSSSDDDVLTQIARETRKMRLQRRYNSVSPSRSVSNQYRFVTIDENDDADKHDNHVPNITSISSGDESSDANSACSQSHETNDSNSQASIRDARIQRLRCRWKGGGVDQTQDNNTPKQQTKQQTVMFVDNGETIHESHATNTQTTESIIRQRWSYSRE